MMCPWPVEGFAEWDRLGDPSAPPEPGRGDSCCCEETPSAEGTSPPRAAWDVKGLDWAMASVVANVQPEVVALTLNGWRCSAAQ